MIPASISANGLRVLQARYLRRNLRGERWKKPRRNCLSA